MSLDGDVIVRVAAKGDGVTADGRHAPLAAPGDRLLGDGTLIAGPHRQVPPCRHFPGCGGCQLQHLDVESEAAFVADRVQGALTGQGLSATVRPALLSPPRTRRRATLHAERRGRQVTLGFSEGASHRIVDLAECHILLPSLFAVVAPLRTLLATALKDRSRADVHLAQVDQGVDVLIAGPIADGLAAAEGLTRFAQEHGLARLSIDDGYGAEARWEPEPVTITLGGVPVPFPAGSFLQATADGEAALVAAVDAAIGSAAIVADLFAGLGTFTFTRPARTRVYAGEAGREAITALKAAAGRAGRVVAADHRDLFRRPLTPAEAERFDAIILDPPRAGAREQATTLAQAKAPIIAYISCNPSSFARDAKMLCEGGYRLDWVQPVGQFRWSTHVELVARFVREDVTPDSPRR
ncbi:RNA methyltransferase [Sphingomonas sp. Leaf407]|uniref:class I SAM-dependent RNA methyltransferase n=1 Tax=unclassified Sphingomonas TaxID=196159 RepID=UPI0006FB4962|nr:MULTISPECIES: class I SAM-dependent RNA methyltransferase [unclassified Sphingomonas]KQN40713.1 RNA methyltransferase [Sphingomonas sp. Leaf42]KQT30068.1 RNA methyltransferase [Sphingomonas sp. Leaf407]